MAVRDDGALAEVLERNIAALLERRRAADRRKRAPERIADRVARFAGSMTFVLIHLAVFGAWALVNLLPLGLPRFDPTLVMLATFASVEAIFISTFVLITQNRMAAEADRRADLDLQISLLAEHEVTRLIRLVSDIAARMDVAESRAPELGELKRDVDPGRVLDRIEEAEGGEAGEGH